MPLAYGLYLPHLNMILLSSIYFLLWRVWIFLYEYKILPVKKVAAFVVSIGNLTVGGTGKTPMTLFLAQHYQARGKRVGIVSRGYRGHYKGPVALVSDGENLLESTRMVGDEPVLMAKRLKGVPIVVARDRFVGCQWLIAHFKTEVILLDDGFQHLRLHRDLNFLLFDATQKNRRLLPKGPMREPMTAACRADAVIVTRLTTPSETFTLPDAVGFSGPLFRTFFAPTALIHLQTGKTEPASELKGMPIIAVCGIGNPNAFTQMLNQLGADIRAIFSFRDHYDYTDKTLRVLMEKQQALGAHRVIITEKDAVKIEPLLAPRMDFWALQIEVGFFDPPQALERILFPAHEI